MLTACHARTRLRLHAASTCTRRCLPATPGHTRTMNTLVHTNTQRVMLEHTSACTQCLHTHQEVPANHTRSHTHYEHARAHKHTACHAGTHFRLHAVLARAPGGACQPHEVAGQQRAWDHEGVAGQRQQHGAHRQALQAFRVQQVAHLRAPTQAGCVCMCEPVRVCMGASLSPLIARVYERASPQSMTPASAAGTQAARASRWRAEGHTRHASVCACPGMAGARQGRSCWAVLWAGTRMQGVVHRAHVQALCAGLGEHTQYVQALCAGLGEHTQYVQALSAGLGEHTQCVQALCAGLGEHTQCVQALCAGLGEHTQGVQALCAGLGEHTQGVLQYVQALCAILSAHTHGLKH